MAPSDGSTEKPRQRFILDEEIENRETIGARQASPSGMNAAPSPAPDSDWPAQSVTVNAPAKVNLVLAVGPAAVCSSTRSGAQTAPEVRHPICSWMVRVTLYDELTLQPLHPGYFSRYAIIWAEDARRKSEIDWSICKDLAVRAHLLLQEHLGRELPVQLTLRKRIPVGAGLGGGSSDAAAMLLGCNQLFHLGLPLAELSHLAAQLGSDVAFFLSHSSSLVSGFGEISRPFPLVPQTASAAHLVLIFPEFGCSTASVYRAFDQIAGDIDAAARFNEARQMLEQMAASGAADISLVSQILFNHLQEAAFQHQPELRAIASAVTALGDRLTFVTGSGSTLFTLCDSAVHAEYLACAIEDRLNLPALPVTLVSD